MTELAGGLGFTLPRSKPTSSRRRTVIEAIATLSLMASLLIAATAVSIGKRALTHDDLIGPAAAPVPVGDLLDQANTWFALKAAQ